MAQIKQPPEIVLLRSISNRLARIERKMALFNPSGVINTAMLNTEEKIERALGKRFDVWAYFRDRVLPVVLIAVIMKVLQLL